MINAGANQDLSIKNSHLDRDREMPVSKAEALKFSKSNSQRKACYAPASMHEDCDKRIVQAHTLSKSSSLKAIADSSNHVMGVVMNLPSLIKTTEDGFQRRLVSIRHPLLPDFVQFMTEYYFHV